MDPATNQIPDMSASAFSEADQVHRQDPSRPLWQIGPRSSQTGRHPASL
jgi:hypothetical protein